MRAQHASIHPGKGLLSIVTHVCVLTCVCVCVCACLEGVKISHNKQAGDVGICLCLYVCECVCLCVYICECVCMCVRV